MWQVDACKGVNDSALGQAVDEIIGVALLIEHLRRLSRSPLPTLADACKGQSHPTIGSVVAAVAGATHNDFLASILQPNDFSTLPVPASLLVSDGKGDLPTRCGSCFATENCRSPSLVIFISYVRAAHCPYSMREQAGQAMADEHPRDTPGQPGTRRPILPRNGIAAPAARRHRSYISQLH